MSTAYCSLTDNKWNTHSLDSSIEKTEWKIICQ